MNPRLPFLLLMVALSFISPVVIAQSAKVLSREEIAQRVEDTLRNAAFCEVTVTVTQIPIGDGGKLKSGTGPVVVHSIMRKDGFKSLAYMNGKLIMAFAFCDGRVEEFRPRAKNRPLLQYDATSLSGMEDTVLQEEEDCLIGGLTFSWVGVPPKSGVDPAGDRAGSYGNKIRNGEQGADVQEQGRTCFVFREIIPVGGQAIRERSLHRQNIVPCSQVGLFSTWRTTNSDLQQNPGLGFCPPESRLAYRRRQQRIDGALAKSTTAVREVLSSESEETQTQ